MRENWALGHAFKQKMVLVCYMTLLGYHVVFLCSIYFVCTCFSVDINLSDSSLLRNLYTWEMVHLYLISYSLVSTFLILCWLFGGSGKEIGDECVSYSIASFRTHSWVVTSFDRYFHLIELVYLCVFISIYSFNWNPLNLLCWDVMLSNLIC